jgi:hypothetical protein
MPADPSDRYATSILRPQLETAGLNSRQQSIVASDVRHRLNSLLTHWHDSPFRRTALLLGVEEASFYEPATVDLDIRSAVVVAVRNSLVEDLGADRPATPELTLRRPAITDSGMKSLTIAAINHLRKYDFAQLRVVPAVAGEDDLFGSLAVDFPNAWRSLSAIANASGVEVIFEAAAPPPLDLPPHSSCGKPAESHVQVVSSGIDPTLDDGLIGYLEQIKEKRCSLFFSDSFKSVTRNPIKLLYILEFVLSHGGSFVTHNYYFGQQYASRREPLLRPCHFNREVTAKLTNQAGLCDRHRQALDEIRSGLADAGL